MSNISEISINDLWNAGVHFGHHSSRRNPKMLAYVYGQQNKLDIIDLRQSLHLLLKAQQAIKSCVKNGGKILFVGRKIQASPIVKEYASRCGQHYVHTRWLGGTLTNWTTISKSIKKLEKIESLLDSEEERQIYTKKELLELSKQKDKLVESFGGIRNMGGKPDMMIVMDTKADKVAIEEAEKLGIPVVAICDTNSNPDKISYPVPGNDDAIKAITLYCNAFASSVLLGIEESLVASGVDIGNIEGYEQAKQKKNITRNSQANKKYAPGKTASADKKSDEDFQKIVGG